MPKQDIDILQIRKYLNGELDAKAMHKLERQAQSDPFLMDALEGYSHTPGDQQANLNELSDRLKRRVSNKGGRIIPWRYLAAAASILVVLTVGGVLLYNRQTANKQRTADIVQPVATDTIAAAKPNAEETNTVGASKPPLPPAEHLKKLSPGNKDVALPEPVIVNDMAVSTPVNSPRMDSVQQQKAVGSSVAAVAPQNSAVQDDVTKPADKALQGRAAGVIADNFSKTYRKKEQTKNLVTGRVIERDGAPLSGATVMVAGTKVATVTNVDGYFSIPVDTSKDKLYIANLGYKSRQVSAHNRDSLAAIKLKPDNSSLNEVVVIGYGTSKKDDDNAIPVNGAHPDSGWGNFNKYLKKNAVSPDGSIGVVKLSFEVAASGVIGDITVTKGLSKAADQKAIDLVNDGPAWVGNTNGQPEKVTVKVKFVKAK